MTSIVVAVALPTVGLLAGCRGGCDVAATPVEARSDLSADVSYLEALRDKAGPEAAENLATARADYAAWTTTRLEEIRSAPWYRARPEEADWSDAAWLGRDTWYHFTSGNQHTWRDLAQRSGGRLDLLRLLDNRLLPRSQRFERFGLINDPSGSAPAAGEDGACVPDAYGLCLDIIGDGDGDGDGDEPDVSLETARLLGRPSGVMGLRVFDNPQFDPALWDAGRPFEPVDGCTPGRRTEWDQMSAATNAAESRDDCYQPPYLVGISCGFCHISFDPESPPTDPAEPGWENLTGHLGNVYFQEGPLFAWMLDFDSQIGDHAFYTDYLLSQPPGTSDTSRIATDDLDNPGAINALYRLDARLGEASAEELPHGGTTPVPMVLKDGADSVGLELAALRVYVNIGMLGNLWLADHDAYLLLGGAPRSQRPFEIDQAMVTPGYDGTLWWDATEARAGDLVTYLSSGESPKLENAPGGPGHLTADGGVLARGRRVFADHCAPCHASQQPAVDRAADPDAWRREMRALVEEPGFFDRDFLADDRRHPASAAGLNLTRSMATNAVAGQVWEEFSSLAYKGLEPLPAMELPDPFSESGDGETVEFCPPAGGRGTYRTASLVGLWATAPFFHNNSVGRHVHDPSVDARVRAFEDAARQLLWPERRTGPDGTPGPYVKRTGDRVTWLPLPSEVTVPVPAGYPIKMLGNLPLHDLARRLPAPLAGVLQPVEGEKEKQHRERIARELLANESLRGLLRRVMLEMNGAPDFIENKGHETIVAGIESDADKRALVELMKTF